MEEYLRIRIWDTFLTHRGTQRGHLNHVLPLRYSKSYGVVGSAVVVAHKTLVTAPSPKLNFPLLELTRRDLGQELDTGLILA